MTFAGYDLPEELEAMRDVVKKFVTERVVPAEASLPVTDAYLPDDVLAGLREQARRADLWCFDAPEEYGGAGLSAFQLVVVLEEACKHRMCFPHAGAGAFGQSPPVVLYGQSDYLTENYVRPTIEHGWGSFTAIGEEAGGSDPARAIKTSARRDGDDWIINGRKLFITNVEKAKYGVVYARTQSGISAFVVDTDSAGLSSHEIPVIRDRWPVELILDDVRVPGSHLVGEEGQGLMLASKWLVRGRLTYAARSVGLAAESLRLAVEWMKDRETFGATLATRQGLQWQVADAQVEIDAGRMLTWRAAWKDDQGEDARLDAAMAKLYCTEMSFRVVDRMMQIMGAMGMSREVPLEKWLRDLRVARVVEGTTEMLRSQVARGVIGPSVKG
ncbi:acyl-CoA dehydrogenase family protein [Nocardioides sp. WS12]|uniref:acyl-CoA dehydrogenase family protein n=1 Tax=Nocardioides sp. WS12 TaxID=2486272 RepID=UPI0015FBB7F0|nr:acyl-CoA dehydrogenase family protein [Nocardioides sp. WS12]